MECNLSKDKDHFCFPGSWHRALHKHSAQKNICGTNEWMYGELRDRKAPVLFPHSCVILDKSLQLSEQE